MDKRGIEIEAWISRFLRNVAVATLPLLLAGLPQKALATTADTEFMTFIQDLCGGAYNPPPPSWDTASLSTMCSAATGAGNVGVPNVAVGSSNAGGGVAARNKKVFREQLDDEQEKPREKGASADGGRWGLLVAPQYGKSHRVDTQLEHGFESELKGLSIGLDYRFSDSLVSGVMAGYVRDNVTYLNDAGTLKTSNTSLTLYGTWLPADRIAVDGYLGYGKNELDSQRRVIYGLIDGTSSGNFTGTQLMGGLSVSYLMDWDGGSVSPFISLDSVESTTAGYNETGTTGLELHIRDSKSVSTTSSVGAQASTTHGFQWGSLSPSVRVAAVQEHQNNAQVRPIELVSAPGVGINVQTDSPDRNYLNAGVGMVAGLNGGTQLFLNYERRVKDELLNSWAASAGVLMEF
jgi:uncharacterized protein YhjY with autotransporter beta-barrel domain